MKKDMKTAERISEIEALVELEEERLRELDRNELVKLAIKLGRELLGHRDAICGPRTAARMFNKKRSWIYEATSRPRTELQKSLALIAAREPGGLLFRLSDLVQLRRQLFSQGGTR